MVDSSVTVCRLVLLVYLYFIKSTVTLESMSSEGKQRVVGFIYGQMQKKTMTDKIIYEVGIETMDKQIILATSFDSLDIGVNINYKLMI